MKTAIIAGCTGLIGSQLLTLLLLDGRYDSIIALSRKALTTTSPRLQNLIAGWDTLHEHAGQLRGNDVFCCLGSTIRQAGSREAFRKVDMEYPLALAAIVKEQGARQYLIVTALGANSHSSIFYNRVKGEVQDALRNIGFETLHILQPSMLIGHRTEKRAGEGLGQAVMTSLDFLIPSKYKAIGSAKVARAMLALAKAEVRGVLVHDSGELQKF